MAANNYLEIIERARQHFNAGNAQGYIETLYAPNATFHYFPPGLPQGYEGARIFYGGFMAAFPDVQFTIDAILMEGDRVAVRYHLDMTHRGEFQGIPPTGKRVRLNGISILRFADDKVVERWNEGDFLGLLQQLGAIPTPEEAGA